MSNIKPYLCELFDKTLKLPGNHLLVTNVIANVYIVNTFVYRENLIKKAAINIDHIKML